MMLTTEQIQEIVAAALEETGHGNTDFIRSVREGRQNDGPFMRGALAVRDALAQAEQ